MSDTTSVSSPVESGTHVTELNLSVRARKGLTALGITTVEQLVQHTAADFLALKNFGVTTLNDMREALARFGHKLRDD